MPFEFQGYKILIHPKLSKSLDKNLPKEYREVFNDKLKYLANNPSHPSLNTKKFNVPPKILRDLDISAAWEFYINGKDYRCIFYVSHRDRQIIIACVGNHTQLKNKFK